MQARAQTATIDRPVKTKNSGNWQVITGFSLAVIVIVTVGWNMESWDLKIVFILKAVITLLGLIFSVWGLQSKTRRSFAVTGLVYNIFLMMLYLVWIFQS